MGGKSVNTSATRAEALTLQSSTYGATIVWLRGLHRLPGNLLWYGDFKATAHTQKQGGKGGGGKSTTYTYSASLVMGLCHGTIVDIPSVWKGKSRTTLGALGITRLSGAVGQPVWSGLVGKGAEAIGYSGLAGVAVKAYELGDNPSLENHSFEVRHASAFSVDASVADVDPAGAVRELMLNELQGAGMPPAIVGDWAEWSDYCIASGLLMSPLLDTQVDASELLEQAADLTNTAIVWSGGTLKMRPYGDQEVSRYGRTFVPDTTPVYQLDDTCYLATGNEAPVKRSLKTPSDCFNQVSVAYKDRANAYNEAIVTAKDRTDIAANGVRPMDTISAHWITEGEVARLVAELKKQRSLLVLGTYSFKLPINFALMEPMDLITLTESALALEDVPVRVKEITEESDFELQVVCEDYPAGVASAPRYPVQTPAGFADDAFVPPGSVQEAAFFEAPAAMAGGGAGLEVWAAVKSPGANWGGCTVHVSLDGVTYRSVARVEGPSRMGLLADSLSSGEVTLHDVSGQLVGASAEDAAALTTLSVILGAQPEYFAYESALLLGPGAYRLGGLVRGAHNTPTSVHAAGDRFIRIDESIARSGGLDVSYIGKRIWFKLTSFNLYGGAEQSLAEVEATGYDVTGVFAKALPGIGGRGLALKASALTVKQEAGGVRTPSAVDLRVELRGTLTGVPQWEVVDGEATLSGSGSQRTVDASTIMPPARIRVTLVDELATYSDEVTLLVVSDGDEGAAGADGSKFTLVSLYQWAPVQPPAPSGQSKWTWATGLQEAYTGGGNWQIGIPNNPGSVGLRLWSASKQISATGGTLTTMIAWGDDATIAAVGANGEGVQTSEAAAYAWGANLPSLPPLQGTAQYTWATGAVSSVPAGWATTPGASASPGLTLFKASVRLQDAASSPTTEVRWVESAVAAVGYSGTSGAAGQAGASYRIAYAKVAGATIGAGQIQTDGSASFPPDNSWGRGETWAGAVPTYGADESVMVTNGVFSPTTNKTTWSAPYLATWRVGKLSAISSDLGSVNAGQMNIGGGKFVVSPDGYLVARGAQLIDEQTGQVIFSTKANYQASLPAAWVNAAPNWLNENTAWSQVQGRPPEDSIRNNLIDLSFWKRLAAIPWPQNQEENTLYATSDVGGVGPKGGSDIVWYAREAAGNGENGGGWDGAPITGVDPSKTYRFVVPIRKRSGAGGNAYWGPLWGQVCDLNTTTSNGNPYFANIGRDQLSSDRWYLFVGYVFPYGSTGNTHDGAGIYDCKTGALVAGGVNFNHNVGGANGHRAYQYYASAGSTQLFGRPMINLVDGTEPSLREYFESGAVLASAIAYGTNLIANSDQSAAMTMAYGNTNGSSIDVALQWASNIWATEYNLQGGTTKNVTLHQNNNNGSGDAGVGVDVYPLGPWDLAHSVPVIPGQRYCFSAYLQSHRCHVGVGLQWFDRLGNFISDLNSGPNGTNWSNADTLANYTRPWAVGVAPATAAYARPYMRKYNTLAGYGESWFWAAAPQLEAVGPAATGPGPYSPAPATSTRQLGFSGDLNATYGATIGQNLGGTFSQQSFDVVMNGQALIRGAHIQSLTVQLLSTAWNGGAQGAHIELALNKQTFFRGNGTKSMEFIA